MSMPRSCNFFWNTFISKNGPLASLFGKLGAYYTERLGKAVIANPPRFFGFVWRFVKSFLDPVTANKFVFVSKENKAKMFRELMAEEDILERFQ